MLHFRLLLGNCPPSPPLLTQPDAAADDDADDADDGDDAAADDKGSLDIAHVLVVDDLGSARLARGAAFV